MLFVLFSRAVCCATSTSPLAIDRFPTLSPGFFTPRRCPPRGRLVFVCVCAFRGWELRFCCLCGACCGCKVHLFLGEGTGVSLAAETRGTRCVRSVSESRGGGDFVSIALRCANPKNIPSGAVCEGLKRFQLGEREKRSNVARLFIRASRVPAERRFICQKQEQPNPAPRITPFYFLLLAGGVRPAEGTAPAASSPRSPPRCAGQEPPHNLSPGGPGPSPSLGERRGPSKWHLLLHCSAAEPQWQGSGLGRRAETQATARRSGAQAGIPETGAPPAHPHRAPRSGMRWEPSPGG